MEEKKLHDIIKYKMVTDGWHLKTKLNLLDLIIQSNEGKNTIRD